MCVLYIGFNLGNWRASVRYTELDSSRYQWKFLDRCYETSIIYLFSWLLAGNSYKVILWWCLTYTLFYLLVTHPPLTILTWLLESWWLFTNTWSFLAVTWTCWVSSTSPLLIYSSAWLIPHHASLISLLSSVTSMCTSDVHSTVTLLFLRVYKSVCWQLVASDLASFVVLLYSGRSQ